MRTLDQGYEVVWTGMLATAKEQATKVGGERAVAKRGKRQRLGARELIKDWDWHSSQHLLIHTNIAHRSSTCNRTQALRSFRLLSVAKRAKGNEMPAGPQI